MVPAVILWSTTMGQWDLHFGNFPDKTARNDSLRFDVPNRWIQIIRGPTVPGLGENPEIRAYMTIILQGSSLRWFGSPKSSGHHE